MSIFQSDDELVDHVKLSISNAFNEIGKLNNPSLLAAGILNFFGMSGKRTRLLLNGLGSKSGIRYAEVGTHMGSTLFSVLYDNENIKAVCCDNWTEFLGPKEEFIKNANMFAAGNPGKNHSVTLFNQDFRTLNFGDKDWSDIDFYNYDGPHREKDQYDGIVTAYPGLADRFILFVDDWNWQGPREGTIKALESLDIEILFFQEIITPDEIKNDQGVIMNRFQNSDWHNGIAVFACKKKRN
jgi:hypothetical protein